jgi:predicted nucleic acid-binding Zn ribbon protein
VDRVCRVCGTTFTGTMRRLYCSTACKRLADHRGATGTCAVCGQAFAGEVGQQYCSRRCAIRARSAERPGARGLGYTAIAARLRALSPEAFAALGETERQAVRLYYGLDGGGGRATRANLREQLGLEQEGIRGLLLTSVARLLGPDAVGATARVCTACGTSFTPLDPWSNQRTCSAACRLERRRQNGRATSPAVRDDIRVQLSAAARRRGRPEREALRALEPEAFGALPDQERQLVRLYYGLDDRELPSIGEVAQQVGLTEAQVRRRLVRAVPQLLGQPYGNARGLLLRAQLGSPAPSSRDPA